MESKIASVPPSLSLPSSAATRRVSVDVSHFLRAFPLTVGRSHLDETRGLTGGQTVAFAKRNMLYRFSLKKRVFLFVLGAALAGLGIAITARASLGTSPISSLPYVLTFLTPLTFGTATILLNALFVAAQAAILGKKFQKSQLLQIPAVALFGFFIDLGDFFAKFFVSDVLAIQVAQLVLGCALLAVGIFFEVIADVLYLPADGIVKAVNIVTGTKFGSIKIGVDFSLAAAALVLSLAALGRLEGLGFGTLISAFLVGWLVKRLAPAAPFVKRRLLIPTAR